jgi:class 3 adenylate cyclase
MARRRKLLVLRPRARERHRLHERSLPARSPLKVTLWGAIDLARQRMERRLAAVLAADVAGYSRLMDIEEEGTLDQLKAHRREFIDPKIGEHRGRTVQTTGDGMLIESSSVVDAAGCSVNIQRGMAERNAAVDQNKQIEFRIGVNIGDIIMNRDDIFPLQQVRYRRARVGEAKLRPRLRRCTDAPPLLQKELAQSARNNRGACRRVLTRCVIHPARELSRPGGGRGIA